MTPTQQQITTASRLQELGVGQGAKKWVSLNEVSGLHVFASKDHYIYEKTQVGPLPNAAECWVEIEGLIKGKKMDITLEPDRIRIDAYKNYQRDNIYRAYINNDLDEAFRQALITLAAQ